MSRAGAMPRARADSRLALSPIRLLYCRARPGDGAAVSVLVGQVEVVDLGGVPAEQLLTSLEGDVGIGEGFRDAN
jgi:hypothetical protein